MKTIDINEQYHKIFSNFLDFPFRESRDEIKNFHEAGALLFHQIYALHGKDLHHNTYPYGNTCLAFELDPTGANPKKGWFILKPMGNAPNLGFHIEFFATKSYPYNSEVQVFPKLTIAIGYHYNSNKTTAFACVKDNLIRNSVTPIVSLQGPKFEGWVSRNTNFEYEFFLSEKIVKELVLPLAEYLDAKFDSEKIEEFKKSLKKSVVS